MPTTDPLALLRTERNDRDFGPEPLPADALAAILEIARWTGSAMNDQPWQFVAVQDQATVRALAELGPNLRWMAAAPLVVALVLDGENPATEGFDEGRLAERIILAAQAQDLAAGLGWVPPGPPRDAARTLLGVPPGRVLRTVVAIGPLKETTQAPPPGPASPLQGRKPLTDLVHLDHFGRRPS